MLTFLFDFPLLWLWFKVWKFQLWPVSRWDPPQWQLTRPGGSSGHSILIRSGDILGYLSRKEDSSHIKRVYIKIRSSRIETFHKEPKFLILYLMIIIGYKFLIIPKVPLKHNGTMELWPRRTFPSLTFLFLLAALAACWMLDPSHWIFQCHNFSPLILSLPIYTYNSTSCDNNNNIDLLCINSLCISR